MIWRRRSRFDVLALGCNHAINLGLSYQCEVLITIFLISLLVSISTTLVGPLTFLGLMAANLSYLVSRKNHHGAILPLSFLLAVIVLLSDHLILEYVLHMMGSLSIVIECIGGGFFIYMILKRNI